MRVVAYIFLFLAASLGITSALAQANAAAGSTVQTPPPSPPPPPPPAAVSPLDYFRKLLAVTPAEREKELASRSGQDRLVLEEKIREFEALSPERREARFQALQRQLDFRKLIRLPQSNRVDQLQLVAEGERQWLSERLGSWDQLAPDQQNAVLTNMVLLRFLFSDGSLQSRTATGSPTLTQQQRDALEKAIANWNQLPDEQQEIIRANFNRFFELDDREKLKALEPLSFTEQRQMTTCLKIFAGLPRSQKEKCMAGFQKFALLSSAERQEFLQNAEQWQKMTPQERQLWRELVTKFRPPRPPTPGLPTPPLPPPLGSRASLRSPPLPLASSTNQ